MRPFSLFWRGVPIAVLAVSTVFAQGLETGIEQAKQALSEAEQKYPPDDPRVTKPLNELALRYFTPGQYKQAEPLFKRLLAILEKALGPDHPSVAIILHRLALIYKIQGQYAQAEALYKRSLAILEKALGPEHPDVARSLNNLAGVYQSQGQYAQSEPLLKRSLAIFEKALGPEHPDVASSLNSLAGLYQAQGRYAQTEPLLKRSLAIQEKALGSEHPSVAMSLHNLALVYQAQGLYAQAEPLVKRSLAIREKVLGPEHPDVASTLKNLAVLYLIRGQYAQAEPLLKRSLATAEKALGPSHPFVAKDLNSLAELYVRQGQLAQAEPLFKRSLAIQEKALGPEHPDVASSLTGLAVLYLKQGRYAQAEPLLKRSLATREKALGPEHPDVASSLNSLAGLYQGQGLYAQAESLYARSLTTREKALGPEHPDVASSLNSLAGLYEGQGLYAQAESLYGRSLTTREKALGPEHPDVAASLNNLARLYDAQDQFTEALRLTRKATALYRKRIVTGGADQTAAQESALNRSGFIRHLAELERNPDQEPAFQITDEAFQVIQLAQASGTGAAVAKMAARFARGDDAIAGLVKRKQDALDRRAQDEANLVKASSQPPDKRSAPNEQQLRDSLTRLGTDIDDVDSELNSRFPEYQELTRPEPLAIAQVQALLRPNEAMIVLAIAERQSWLWVVRPDKAEFIPIKADHKTLTEQIKKLRGQMDFNASGAPYKADVASLHQLYQSVFAPAVPHLTGVQHILLVPSGPLQSLPVGMFVASPPNEIRTDADYAGVDWLVKHYAFSVLPSVSSIRAFRQFAKAAVAQLPFIGFGDPLLTDDSAATRSARSRGKLHENLRDLMSAGTATAQGDIANVELIRLQVRLPETADEIKAMARIVEATPNSLWLQERATETNVKTLDLSKYRILAFATHGVMAGEIGKGMEAGLLLTPPKVGTIEDDGYLTAGEIAKLKLNADWVLLSACNTAAADGTPGAEGMSGLAKAFFYAGTRSMLVSHWPVVSETTVPLTTVMLREYATHPEQGKAEAQRKAILALMHTKNHPEYAHPLFWAPFVVVGEGGASTQNVKK